MNMCENRDVFISYRRNDQFSDGTNRRSDEGLGLARALFHQLTRLGVRCFFDLDAIKTNKFDEKIYESIDHSKYLIFVFTPHALDRCANEGDWVRNELEYALRHGKTPIVVTWKGDKPEFPSNLPASLCDLKTIHVSDIDRSTLFDESVKKLVNERLEGVQLADEQEMREKEQAFLTRAREYKYNDGVIDEKERCDLDSLALEMHISNDLKVMLIESVRREWNDGISFKKWALSQTNGKTKLTERLRKRLSEEAKKRKLTEEQTTRLIGDVEYECAKRSTPISVILVKFIMCGILAWLCWLLLRCIWENFGKICSYLWYLLRWPTWGILVLLLVRGAWKITSRFKTRMCALLFVGLISVAGFTALRMDMDGNLVAKETREDGGGRESGNASIEDSVADAKVNVGSWTASKVFKKRSVEQARNDLDSFNAYTKFSSIPMRTNNRRLALVDFRNLFSWNFSMPEIGGVSEITGVEVGIVELVKVACQEPQKLKQLGMQLSELEKSRPDLLMRFVDIREAAAEYVQTLIDAGNYEAALESYTHVNKAFSRCRMTKMARPEFTPKSKTQSNK